MRYVLVFCLLLVLGIGLVFGYKKISQIYNGGQLKSPLAQSQFFLDIAPSESLKGIVVSFKGDVEFQDRTATVPALIKKPVQIQQGEEIITGENGETHIVIENVLDLVALPKTKIGFVQTLPSNIVLSQESGTVWYRKLGKSPVSVRSLSLLTTIRDGEIVLTVKDKESVITVDVRKGSISAGYNDIDYITQTLEAKEGESLIFDISEKTADVGLISKPQAGLK